MSEQTKTDWGARLCAWYRQVRRDLPWRRTSDPYAIWISEIMLQQTRVEGAMEYYRRFLERFPTLAALASAEEEEVLKMWEGLGYYSRAKNLHKAAQMICDAHAGVFPETYEAVRALPGIGDYTVGAIMSIAFHKPYAAVDGNVLRVMSRLFAIDLDIMEPKTRAYITSRVQAEIVHCPPSDFTQGLMELGALVCLPGTPKCMLCPLTSLCEAHTRGLQQDLPVKKKKPPQKVVARGIAILEEGGKILLTQRTGKGVLSGLWEFPGVDCAQQDAMSAMFGTQYGMEIQVGEHCLDAEHVFTHLRWQMRVYRCKLLRPLEESELNAPYQWVGADDLPHVTIPTAFRKIVKYCFYR